MDKSEDNRNPTGSGTSNAVIKVAIIEDQRNIREGLAALIDGTEGFCCTAVFSSMEEALSNLDDPVPDVVLVDIGLPGMSGIDGIRILRGCFPNLVPLILTVFEDNDRIFDALCAGACGYLLKRTPPARLLESIREVFNGGAPMSPEVAKRAIEMFRNNQWPDKTDYHLTPHEMRLLKLLVEGHNYKTAAAELSVTVNTISFHTRRIYEKLHVHSKSEAIAKALRTRLIK